MAAVEDRDDLQGTRALGSQAGSLTSVAQTITIVAAVLVPLVAAIMVFWVADRDLNTAIAIIQASDPLRVAFVALLAIMPVVVALPQVAWVFLDRMFADWKKHWYLMALTVVLVGVSAGILAGWIIGSISAVLFLVALSLRWGVANGASRRAIGVGFFGLGWFYFLLLQFVNPYPEAMLGIGDTDALTRVYLINESSDGTWFVPVDGTAQLHYAPGAPKVIVICTRRHDPCADAVQTPEPSASEGAPSSSTSPSSR